jgi:hypothetical protein
VNRLLRVLLLVLLHAWLFGMQWLALIPIPRPNSRRQLAINSLKETMMDIQKNLDLVGRFFKALKLGIAKNKDLCAAATLNMGLAQIR